MMPFLSDALGWFYAHQSQQTSLIHYYPSSYNRGSQETIAIKENVLFSLCLLRTKQVDAMKEGMEVLSRILHFQNLDQGTLSYGNFPLFLHHYPQCFDRYHGIHLLLAMWRIDSDFHFVLGKDLKQRLLSAMQRMVEYFYCLLDQKDPRFDQLVLLLAILWRLLSIFPNQDRSCFLKKKWDSLDHWKDHIEDFLSDRLGNIFLALSILPKSWSSCENWKEFWRDILVSWDVEKGLFLGPHYRKKQTHTQGLPSFSDYFLENLFGKTYPHLRQPCPAHRFMPLIYPLHLPVDKRFAKTSFLCPWTIQMHEKMRCMYFKDPLASYAKSCLYPLSLHGQGSSFQTLHFKQDPYLKGISSHAKGVDLYLELCHKQCLEPPPDHLAVFYYNRREGACIKVGGVLATCFNVEDVLQLLGKGFDVSLSCEVIAGQGSLKGHIMPSNRPNQWEKDVYVAHDWMIFLRCIGLSEDLMLKISLRWD